MLAGTDLTKAAGPDTIKLKWHKIIFKKSLDSGQIPIGKRQLLHLLNQRTGGPVNAHLTHGLVIYFNAFIHVYSPRAGADNPFGTNVDVNSPYHFAHLLQVLKQSVWSMILKTF